MKLFSGIIICLIVIILPLSGCSFNTTTTSTATNAVTSKYTSAVTNKTSTTSMSTSITQSLVPELPLEGGINFSVHEANGVVSISISTDKIYGNYENLIKTNLTTVNSKSFRIDILYIYNPDWPYAEQLEGPA